MCGDDPDVVNNRLASALAVPDIVRGIDNGQTYANAEQAERSFGVPRMCGDDPFVLSATEGDRACSPHVRG